MIRTSSLLILASLFAVGCRKPTEASHERLSYPETRRGDHVDTYHGVEVADPYRWLEDDNSAETKAWVTAQNKVTSAYLGKIGARDKIRKQLEDLYDYAKQGPPTRRGKHYFYMANSGLQKQNVLYVKDKLDGKGRVLLDANKLSKDGTTALMGRYYSRDGKRMAYAVSEAGSDWRTIRVMDVDTGKDLSADVISNVKFSGASWAADGSGFYYSSFPAPKEGEALTARNLNQKIYFHRLGTPQSEDVMMYERPDEPTWGLYCGVTHDGSYLFIAIYKGSGNRAEYYTKNLDTEGPVTPLITGFENGNEFLGNEGTTFYFLTDRDAPKRRIVAVDLADGGADKWRELVPPTKNAIEDAWLIGNRFVVHYLKHANSLLQLHNLDGTPDREVELPTLGSIWGVTGEPDHDEMFLTFSSFTYPRTVMRYDFKKGELEAIWKPSISVNPNDYVVEQVAYQSKDSQNVTMFIARKKRVGGFLRDSSHPTLLYGYGGFRASMTPHFSEHRLLWMDMGGIYCVANLRGGAEYGEAWHQAGMREKKQNVFDDFITAGASLIANKYTSTRKLAIQGGSNGGLLVGACMNQHPRMFAVCLPAVGVMDMLRFHKFTIGRAWVGEYGSSDDPDMFEVLHGYSPYHNLKKGVFYPATMVTTADHDDRVVPAHSFKYAARLQACQAGDRPVLIRIETSGGHGGGLPLDKRLDALADTYAFLAANLHMKLPRRYR